MSGPRLTPLVQSLPATVPFVGPEAQERASGRRFSARIGANESLFGPSPKVIDAIRDAATGAWKYGDPENFELKQMLAGHLGVAPENVVVGEGIDGLLGYIARMCVAEGDAVVTSDGAYPTFNYHVAGFGGVLHKRPYDNEDREDLPALFARAAEVDAKLVYLANPDNPMGTSWSGQEILRAMEALPQGTLLVLDEAYLETAPVGTSPDLPWADPRLLRLRTFSKAYGLAGARVGYAVGAPDLITAFNKIRNHFGMTRGAQAAALAALEDAAWLNHVRQQVETSRAQIADIAREAGLTPLSSATNFVAIDCGQDAAFAKAVLEALIAEQIFVRMPFVAPQNRCIRVSCGAASDMEAFAKGLRKALADLR